MSSAKTVFMHVGCRKSGTSGLQLGLKRAADALRATGLEQPLGARGGIMGGLVDPLRDALQSGDDTAARRAVARLATAVAESPHPRHLITLEALAELPEEATSLVVAGLSAHDVRLVVTVRPWVFTLPSEWQQLVKARFTTDYLTYARAMRHPEDAPSELAEEAVRFRRRQDVADVARRWRVADPALPVTVVLVPPSRLARPDLTELFCQVLEIDPVMLPIPDRMVNPSISHEHAEVLRLVNVALGDRLPDKRRAYRYSVRKWIAVATMMRGSAGTKIRLPRDLEPCAAEESSRQLAELDAMGVTVLGDPEGFTRPPLSGEDFVPASDGDVARAAAGVLADLAQGHARERRRARRTSRRQARRTAGRQSRSAGDTTPATPVARRDLVTRASGALRRRVRPALRRRKGS